MLFVKNFKVVLLFLSITCCFNANAAFTAQPDSIKTGNFLLLTPIKESLADQYKLRTKEHLIINENERIKYQLKDERGTKRGRIIRISDKEIQVYNQVTGKLEVVKIDNLKTISRRQGWKAWAGYFSLYVGVTALIYSIFLAIFAIIFLIRGRNTLCSWFDSFCFGGYWTYLFCQ